MYVLDRQPGMYVCMYIFFAKRKSSIMVITVKYLEWMTIRGSENVFLVFYFSLSA